MGVEVPCPRGSLCCETYDSTMQQENLNHESVPVLPVTTRGSVLFAASTHVGCSDCSLGLSMLALEKAPKTAAATTKQITKPQFQTLSP